VVADQSTGALLKTKFWAVGLACFLLFCVAPASALAGTISGTITADGGGPIQGFVSVCAEPEEGSAFCEPVSEGSSEYTITAPAGKYRVSFNGAGNNYVSQYWRNSSSFLGATVIDLAEGDSRTGIDADMVTGAEVSGTIVETDGKPLHRVAACVREVDGNETRTCSLTNEEGEYVIASIAPGDYLLSFEEGFSGPEYVKNFWPEKSTEGEAEVLTFAAGDSMKANATLVEAGRIEGTLTGEGEVPSSGEVCAYKPDGRKVACEGVAGESNYQIGGLAPGSYVVGFTIHGHLPAYSGGAKDFADATPVTVQAGGSASASADLESEPGISGTVTALNTGEPIEGVEVCVEENGAPGGCVYTDEDGKYTFYLFPGTYRVRFGLDGYATKYYATTETIDGALIRGVDAALEEAGSLTGRVATSDGGTDLGDVEVCALGAGSKECVGANQQSGEYRLLRLAPGAYKVRFSLHGHFTQYFDDKATEAEAEPVTVTAGHERGGVDATLIAEEAPRNVIPPLLSGVGKIGETLSCGTGVWAGNPPSFTYEYFWFRGEEEIEGAESSTYRLGVFDAGESISCGVVATNSGGSEGEFSSNEIAVPELGILFLAKAGDGTGTVSSAPSGIDCGGSCAAFFEEGTAITLTAVADSGSEFTGWSGACSGTGPCVVVLGAEAEVVAGFARQGGGDGDRATRSTTRPSPATPTPTPAPPARTPPATKKPAPRHQVKKQLRCKKGFRAVKHKGKSRCVKKARPKHRRPKVQGAKS
jgi:hypothetical protein